MANGFQLLADDFLPVDSSGGIRFFPAALSVKKKAAGFLSTMYPELKIANEFHYNDDKKVIRYLASSMNSNKSSFFTKAIIIVKYQKDVSIDLKKISAIDAFEKLVPDTWISPIVKNAKAFLDWFSDKPCYRLIYSDNERMVSEIKKLFNDDL
jgi:hypothetical protein